MPLAIVTCPEIPPSELAWIEDLRGKHLSSPETDIPPHVMLVYPAEFVMDENLTMHMYGVTGSTQPFEAIFRIAAPAIDPIHGGWRVQLLPDEGLSKLMRMHNFLYTGPIADHVNYDIPYVPHLTIARTETGPQANALCEELNSSIIEVSARFTTVKILRIEGGEVTTEAEHELEG
jgi:hypothetical protein